MNTFHLYNAAEEKVLIVNETFGGYIMVGLPKSHYSHIDGYYTALGYVSNQVWRWENTDRRIKKEDINKLIELGILNGSKWNKEDE